MKTHQVGKDIWRRSIHFYSSTSGRDIFKIKPCFFLTSVQNTPFRKSLQKTGQDDCAVFVPWVHTVHRLTKPKLDPVIGFLHPLRINIPRWISSWVKPSHVPRRTYSSKSEGNSTESASGWHRYVVWWFLFDNWENEQDLKPQEGVCKFFWWIVPQKMTLLLIPCS